MAASPPIANAEAEKPREMAVIVGRGAADGSPSAVAVPQDEASAAAEPFSLEAYFMAEINTRWSHLILLLSYLCTGLLDSVAVHVWGSFVSMQTGNTVYIGLGLAGAGSNGNKRWIKSSTSLFCFCVGSFLFSRYQRMYQPKRRWVLTASFALQAVFVIAAAIIVGHMDAAGAAEGGELRWQVLLPIAIIAFQSSAQAQISRALGYNALTSVVLTSIYCDLFGDQKLFEPLTKNVSRNQRIAAPVMLCFGAFLGGRWAQTETGMAGALWTAAFVKVVALVACVLWPRKVAAPPAQK